MIPRHSRALVYFVLCLGLSTSVPAPAHDRSESFSRWHWSGQTLSMRFTVDAREASRIPVPSQGLPLDWVLSRYLENHVLVDQGGDNCKSIQSPQALVSREGFLQVEAIWRCEDSPTSLSINAFFDLAAEHTHFSSYDYQGNLSQKLLNSEQQLWQLTSTVPDDETTDIQNSGFQDYLQLGFRHILSGLDHIFFLVALMLICQRPRELIWAITGFTLGHSLSLTLAALGWVQINTPAIEATIGLTIALLAIERTNIALKSALPLAIISAGLLLLLIPLSSAQDAFHGSLAIGGLALFSFCYLLAAHELNESANYRLLITALFGLVHGFGFSNAFLDGTLSAGPLLVPLAGFNIGVELGQLALLALMLFIRFLFQLPSNMRLPAADIGSGLVCAFGVFWFIERTFV